MLGFFILLPFQNGGRFWIFLELRLNVLTDYHEIRNQRTWYKGGTTYVWGYVLISIPFQNGGLFFADTFSQNALADSHETYIS